jgi:hypothetical protein
MAVEPELGGAQIESAVEIPRDSSGICESICRSTCPAEL